MTPSTPHIVCFAPYTDWSIHSARQVNILHALSVRGATSTYVTCDGVFSDCDLFQEATGAVQGRRANSCLICQASVAARLAAWAGYVGTTGVAAMDWLIADSHHTPDGYERWASERIVRLPHDYICYRPPVEAPPVMDLPSDTAERVTFGLFQQSGQSEWRCAGAVGQGFGCGSRKPADPKVCGPGPTQLAGIGCAQPWPVMALIRKGSICVKITPCRTPKNVWRNRYCARPLPLFRRSNNPGGPLDGRSGHYKNRKYICRAAQYVTPQRGWPHRLDRERERSLRCLGAGEGQ